MFKKIFFLLLLFPILSFSLNKYKIEFEIDFKEKTITGKGILNFTNTYNFPLKNLYFNLYQNGFQEDSTLWKEGIFLNSYKDKYKDDAFSFTNIQKILVNKNLADFRFISPEDENNSDETLLELDLDNVLFPEETAEVEIYFVTKLHRYYFRNGFSDDSLYLMQWYPKLCVFEQGKWKVHQFHSFTEFYGEFLDFEIDFEVPLEWKVVGTGKVIEEESKGFKKIKINAENVHDVAIVLSRELKKIKKIIDIIPDSPVELDIFIPSEYNYKIPRIMDILKKCFQFYNDWIGPYLYSNFTIVFPSWSTAQGRVGMEYPQLILCGINHLEPENSFGLEYVIAHEFAHQYFYGLLASDEVDEPWLDEGFTTYISSTFIQKNYPIYKVPLPKILKYGVVKSLEMDFFLKINSYYYFDQGNGYFLIPGWQHPDYLEYRIYSYNKPAMALKTLEKYEGEEKMKDFLQDYFSSFSFLHPHTEDVIKLIEKKFGMLWAQNFYNLSSKPQRIDYSAEILSEKKFLVRRSGEFIVPVEILVYFKDNTQKTLKWDGIKSFQIFDFKDKEVKKVILDPQGKIFLDLNPLNNVSHQKKCKSNFFCYFFSKAILLFESLICWF